DFNEQAQCGASSNGNACASNSAAGLPTAVTTCGNGLTEFGEACDDGPANGPYPAACSRSCTRNVDPPPSTECNARDLVTDTCIAEDASQCSAAGGTSAVASAVGPSDDDYKACWNHLALEVIGKIGGKGGKALNDFLTAMECMQADRPAALAKACMGVA